MRLSCRIQLAFTDMIDEATGYIIDIEYQLKLYIVMVNGKPATPATLLEEARSIMPKLTLGRREIDVPIVPYWKGSSEPFINLGKAEIYEALDSSKAVYIDIEITSGSFRCLGTNQMRQMLRFNGQRLEHRAIGYKGYDTIICLALSKTQLAQLGQASIQLLGENIVSGEILANIGQLNCTPVIHQWSSLAMVQAAHTHKPTDIRTIAERDIRTITQTHKAEFNPHPMSAFQIACLVPGKPELIDTMLDCVRKRKNDKHGQKVLRQMREQLDYLLVHGISHMPVYPRDLERRKFSSRLTLYFNELVLKIEALQSPKTSPYSPGHFKPEENLIEKRSSMMSKEKPVSAIFNFRMDH